MSAFKPRISRSATWKLNDDEISTTFSFTHLGLNRYAGKIAPNDLVSSRIELACRTRYAIMGFGLHGIYLVKACSIYNTYVLPRYFYNFDVCILTTKKTPDKQAGTIS
jgi:hypothetical protein